MGNNLSGLQNSSGYDITNYQMTAHIQSSTPNPSMAVFPGSSGNANDRRYNQDEYSIYYNGFVVVSKPWIILSSCSNGSKESGWWMDPFISMARMPSSSSCSYWWKFTMSSGNSADMPLNGYIRLDVYTNTLTQICKTPW